MSSQERGDNCMDDGPRSEDESVHDSDVEFIDDSLPHDSQRSEFSVYGKQGAFPDSDSDGAFEEVCAAYSKKAMKAALVPDTPAPKRRIIQDTPSPAPEVLPTAATHPSRFVRMVVRGEIEEARAARAEEMSPCIVAETPDIPVGEVPPFSAAKERSVKVAAVKKGKGAPQGSQCKHWCWTYNDFPIEWLLYSSEEFERLAAAFFAEKFQDAGMPCSYVCVAREETPSKPGTYHLQGYLALETKRRLSELVKVYPQLAFFACKGTPQQNDDYCSGMCEKKGKVRNPYYSCVGVLAKTSGETQKQKWASVVALAKASDLDGLAEEHPQVFVSHLPNLQKIAQMFKKPSTWENPHEHRGIWITGQSGRGKTSAVRAFWPNVFYKVDDAQWNGYAGQDVALLDDFSKEKALMLAPHLKHWCDHLPFPGRILYGTTTVHLKYFVVSSNYSMEELFINLGDAMYQPLVNRFRQIKWDFSSWKDVPLNGDGKCALFDDAELNKIPFGHRANLFDIYYNN